MVEHVYLFDCDNINPYHNLAAQQYLFNHIPDNSMVFMVWQNNETVLLGNSSQAYSECNVSQLEMEHTHLARRDSFGSTIYNDLGTLNFSFFLYLNNYDIEKQINVLYQGLRQLGLPVYMDSANEIMMSGGKLTESVYMTKAERCMHAISLHWDTDKNKRGRLLKEKNSKKKIVNITDYSPIVTPTEVKRRILQCLADKYGSVYQLTIPEDIEAAVEQFHSYRFIYKTDEKYTVLINENYDLGPVQLYVDLIKNKIVHLDIYMNEENQELKDLIHKVFDGLKVDEIYFNKRMDGIESSFKADLTRLFKDIRKESYRI